MTLYNSKTSQLVNRHSTLFAIKVSKIALIVLAVLPLLLLFYAIARDRIESLTSKTKLENVLNQNSSTTETQNTKDVKVSNPDIIVRKALFGVIGLPTPIATPVSNKPVSKVPLTLIGTFLTDKQKPSAIVEDKRKGDQDLFDIGDTMFGEAKLTKVFNDHIEIDRNGELEILTLDDSGAAAEGNTNSGAVATNGNATQITVSEAEVDSALSNLPVLLTQVRAVPFFKDGTAVGLRLFAIKQGSIFEKVNLKNGDILKTINGTSMADFTQAMKLFEKLKSERSLSLVLERNKEEINYQYSIK